MIPLIVIRPQPGADGTVAAAARMGIQAHAVPLFDSAPVAWDPPEPRESDALLVGSANAVRQAGVGLLPFADKPAYVVGLATAEACREAGLTVAATGSCGLQAVLDRVGPCRLLRLAGREHVPLTTPPGVKLSERIVYASNPRPMPAELAQILALPCVVMLHSALAAEHLAAECVRLGIEREHIRLATIGRRVTDAAGSGWAQVATAVIADDAALLAQAVQLCQNRARTLDS
jgi:uroporphyrinogen-III synthase